MTTCIPVPAALTWVYLHRGSQSVCTDRVAVCHTQVWPGSSGTAGTGCRWQTVKVAKAWITRRIWLFEIHLSIFIVWCSLQSSVGYPSTPTHGPRPLPDRPLIYLTEELNCKYNVTIWQCWVRERQGQWLLRSCILCYTVLRNYGTYFLILDPLMLWT